MVGGEGMTVREDLEKRISDYENQNTIIGDAMAIACHGAMMQMTEDQLNEELDGWIKEDVELFNRENS